MSVYLLHFEPSYRHAGHYIGFCTDDSPDRRLEQHLAGRGSPLVKAAVAAGSTIKVAQFFPGASRTFERKLKNWGSAKKWCPACGLHLRPIPTVEEVISVTGVKKNLIGRSVTSPNYSEDQLPPGASRLGT